ncbi:hypothetical protein BB558_003994 [Smittium angustum]|uniref:Uncharacterized protein n=1 Tax=Smittium angustum TaxID=133377 RepID=A0A2U1J4E7_SMIAN|nr:hypothetical protein BB558_003994 [Smittium angustum]
MSTTKSKQKTPKTHKALLKTPDLDKPKLSFYKTPSKVLSFDAILSWYFYWIFLGVLSSIGLGSGLHTFVLFLGPFIAKVTFLAHECGNTSFYTYGPKKFICRDQSNDYLTFTKIYSKVFLECFFWGAGTALGELPPYFLARAAASGKTPTKTSKNAKNADNFSSKLKKKATDLVLVVLERYAFIGILIFASIPNPLFDLAGIMCGHFGIPFWTFFGATLIGKALIKSGIQSSVVIFAFSKEFVDVLIKIINNVSPNLENVVSDFIEAQKTSMAGNLEPEKTNFSIISAAWNLTILFMILYFLVGLLETLAESYQKTLESPKKTL